MILSFHLKLNLEIRHWSASETEKSLYVNAGDMILIRMNENPGTGYRWQLVTDDKDGFDQTLCQLQPTSGFADGLYEPSTSTDGSDDKVVDGVARPYVPPGLSFFESDTKSATW